MENRPRVEDLLDRHKRKGTQRQNFESYWQSLHDYFYVEAQNFNRSYAKGSELDTTNLYDSTTLEVADVMASGFMNYLTPPTSKWFRLKAKDPILQQDKRVADYLEDVTSEVLYALGRSNFYDQCFPSYKSSGVYGTSILFEEEDIEDDIRFTAMPLKQVVIVEDGRGRVCEYYIDFEYSAYQAASRWGADSLSTELREELKARTDDRKHKFLLYIARRQRRDIRKTDKRNMPIEALWIDVEGKRTMEESGYNEFPAMTHRFDKRPFIEWGFSPAMKALPFARLLNAVAKTNLRAMMKRTDPPIAIPENSFIMPFNANPRAINYYNRKNIQSQNDIFAFANYGDPQFGIQAVEYYSAKVKKIMFNDVFLAFENITKQMNNPEIAERINEKMTQLAPAVGRWIAEVVNPTVTRTIGILSRLGKLPPPPDELIQNPEYEVECLSQLAQAQKRSELNNLITAMSVIGQSVQLMPDIIDNVDADKFAREVWDVTGANVQILRDDSEISELRESRAEQLAQDRQMGVENAGAETAKTASEVEMNVANANRQVQQ
jgi:hypothetical protein